MTPINLQYTTIKTPLPNFIYQGLKEYSRDAHLYYPQAKQLVKRIADKYHLPQDMIFLTAGIDEALQMLCLAYGQHAYTFTPTYIVYSDVNNLGGHLNTISAIKATDYVISPDKIPQATLIFLANPNNPSGCTPKEKVIKLIENNSHAIVVIDEAYSQFADLSAIDQVKKYPHLVVLRSFSKDYGMAGNRIGWITAHPKVIKKINRPISYWASVSYLSVGAAMAALDHEDYFAQLRTDINTRRDQFINFLKNQNFQVFPSHINAVLIKFKNTKLADHFIKYLANYQITISQGNGFSNIGLDDSFVRIAIGTPDQMTTVQQVISKFSAS